MPEQTDTWRPDAEPWEALREAQKSGAAPVHMAKALSEMGWRLAPAYRGEGKTGAEIMADPPEWPVPVLAAIDDLRNRVDALESEIRDARANARVCEGEVSAGQPGRRGEQVRGHDYLQKMASEPTVTVTLTQAEARILRSFTRHRAAVKDAKLRGDWSVDVDRKLQEALAAVEEGEQDE